MSPRFQIVFSLLAGMLHAWVFGVEQQAGEPPVDANREYGLEVEVLIVEDSTISVAVDAEEVPANEEWALKEDLPPIEKVPELKRFVDADYPADLVRKGVRGTVVLDLLITDSGVVDSVAVVIGIDPVLDSSAVAAAWQFVFSPAVAGGKPVPVIFQYGYRFSFEDVVEKVQNYANFRGRLLEMGTRTPIADAMVAIAFLDTACDTTLKVPFGVYRDRIGTFEGQYLEEDKLVALTDQDGNFTFYSLPLCSVEVSAVLPGYEVFEERELITEEQVLEATYYVPRISYSDYEIVVYGKAEKKEVSRRQLTISEIRRIPGLGGDAVKVVQALPGVARPTFGGPQIVVRGSGTADSRYFLDGIELPQLYHFGLKSTYNSEALQSVDFYPGGFGTRYGCAIAGIVELTGRKARTDRWHGHADASFIDASLMVEAPLNEKVSFIGAARRSFIGEIIKAMVKNMPSTTILTGAPFYWDYLARTDFAFSDRHQAYVTAFGSKDGMELIATEARGGSDDVGGAKNAFDMELVFHMGLLGHDWRITDALINSTRYSATRVLQDVSILGFAKTSADMWLHHLRNQLTLVQSDRLTWNLGADVQFAPLDLTLGIYAGQNTIQKDTSESNWLFGDVGVYANLEWKPTRRLQIIPGVRYDYFHELDYHGANFPEFWDYEDIANETRFSGEPSLRVNCRYEFVKGHFLKGALGNYSQTPEPMGQAIHPTWGDPHLSATRAAQYVLGYEWQMNDLLHLDLQGYYNRQWKVPGTALADEILQGARLFVDNGKKYMRGLEVMVRHEQSEHFFGWLAYSLLHSRQYDYESGKYVPTDKDQTHNVIAVGSWRLPGNWEAGFKLQYTTGDPLTPVVGEETVEHHHGLSAERGETNSGRLPPSVQLDLRFDRKYVFKKWVLSTYVDFFNIGYFLYKSPQFSFVNSGDPYDEVAGKPNMRYAYQYSLPSVGIKAEF